MTITTLYIVTTFVFLNLAFFALPSMAICIAASIGMWFAFGTSSLYLRALTLVVGLSTLGLTGATIAERPWGSLSIDLVFLVIGLAFWFGNEGGLFWLWLLFGLWVLFIYRVADDRVLSSVWAIRIVLFSYVLCLPFAMLRLFGFRFMNITGGVSEQRVDSLTGRSLADWFAILDRTDAMSKNHAEIMLLLREYGLDYPQQRMITIAYLQSRERSSPQLSPDGTLVGSGNVSFTSTMIGSKLEQFTIGHLLFTTFVVACVVKLATYLKWPFPSRDELILGGIGALGIAVVLTALLIEFLAIQRTKKRSLAIAFLAIAIVLFLPIPFGGNAGDNILTKPGQIYYGGVLFALYPTGMFLFVLNLVRRRGYRLVRFAN